MRPGVVWFGEQLPRNELERVEDFLDGGACDVVIVAGTTATFGYIIDWALRGSRDGAELIEVNPEETPLSRFATRLVREPAAIALPRIVDQIDSFLGHRENESDARTHRTPRALRAKSYADGCSVLRKLWECARVLAPLLDPTN